MNSSADDPGLPPANEREQVLNAAATCAAAAQRLQHSADLDDEHRALVDVIVEKAFDIKSVVADGNIDPITHLQRQPPDTED